MSRPGLVDYIVTAANPVCVHRAEVKSLIAAQRVAALPLNRRHGPSVRPSPHCPDLNARSA
jgi:hypothetical protein